MSSIPSSSALAWLDHARKLLGQVADEAFPIRLPQDVLDGFNGYLEQWFWAADAGPAFHWRGEVDPEVACHLVHHWHTLVQWATESRGAAGPTRPAEGDAFYAALVDAVTDALVLDDCTHAFGEGLRASWPGLPTR